MPKLISDDAGDDVPTRPGDNAIARCLTRGSPDKPDPELTRMRENVIAGFANLTKEEQKANRDGGYVPHVERSYVGSRKMKAKGGAGKGHRGKDIVLRGSRKN